MVSGGKPRAALRFRRQKHVDKITVFVDSDFAGDPVSRKSTMGLVAQVGNHIVKSGSTLQTLRSSWTILEIYVPRLGVPTKIEIQSDSSTANSLTDRLRAGQGTKHIDTRYCWTRTSPRRRPRNQEGAYSKELRRCWNETSLCFSTTANLQVWRIGILLAMDSTLHNKMKADEPMMHLVKNTETGEEEQEHKNRQFSTLIVNIETDVQAESSEW